MNLVANAHSIATELAAQSAESEEQRHLTDAAVQTMADAGLWQILTPRTYGGLEAGLAAQVDTVLIAAEAYSAAGWSQLVINAHSWIIGSFPVACADEVFASGPNTRIPGTLASQGSVRHTDDGWVLNGRWQFASGVDHGDWLLMGALVDQPAPGQPRAVHVVVPKADLVVDDTWHTLGLRGSGSKDLVADDVLVPAHRSMDTRELFEGLSPHGERHATHFNRLPVIVCLNIQLAAAVLGMANAALSLFIDRTKAQNDGYIGAAKSQRAGIQMRVAESAAELASGRLLVDRAAERCDLVASDGTPLTTDERAELKWHSSYVVELARRATDRLYAVSGAHAVYNDSALQTRYRDVNTACHHAIADMDSTAEMYGRVQLGLGPGTPLV